MNLSLHYGAGDYLVDQRSGKVMFSSRIEQLP